MDSQQNRSMEQPDTETLLRMIFQYAARIANERHLDRILMHMADLGRGMVGADRCTVWLLDRQRNELWTAAAHGVRELRIPADAGLAGLAVATGQPLFIDDAYTNEPYSHLLKHGALRTDKETGYRTKALLVIPFGNSEGEIIGCFQAVNKLTPPGVFTEKDLEYLTLAASYSGKSLESAMLLNEIEETQKEIILSMGEIGEMRSRETGHHVRRVAEYSHILALGYGLPPDQAEMLRIASPMHDIGKVAIPDAILNKPGRLTPEEFSVMQTHTEIGYRMLKKSPRPLMQTAAIVAHQHHEKWDGSGYPQGLAGESIHIFGRITAIADVFDALGSERTYKKAWPLDKIIALLREERGRHFDPALVDVFLDRLPELLEIRRAYTED